MRSFLDNFLGKLIFSLGIVSSLVTQLCTVQDLPDNRNYEIIVWYNIGLAFVSVFFIIFGYLFLFDKSPNNNIGSHDKGMGLVVAFISTLVVGLEIVLIVLAFKNEILSFALDIFFVVFDVEKVVQVVFYIGMRRCVPRPDFKRGTVFYFHFLSFLNFTLWLNSISFTDIQIFDKISHSYVLQYVNKTFKALVIDYRLLCALLFLEHAMEIDNEDGHNHMENDVDKEFEMPIQRNLYAAIGLGIGLVFLVLEVLNAVQFLYDGFPDFVNLFPIVVDVCLVVLGFLLLNNVNISVLHNEKVSIVFFMVTSMGAVSIIYLLSFGLLSLISFRHDKPFAYVKWSACVFISRGLSLLLLLLVYTGIPVRTMESRINFKKSNYLLVSALWFGLFAKFLGNVLDEFNGRMNEIAHKHIESQKLRTLQDLFVLGPLFQLATTLHVALHFLVMLLRLRDKPVVDVDEGQNVQGRQGNEEAEPGQGIAQAEQGEGNLEAGQGQENPVAGQEQGNPEAGRRQENEEAEHEQGYGQSEEHQGGRKSGQAPQMAGPVGSCGAVSVNDNEGTGTDVFVISGDDPSQYDEHSRLLQPDQHC